MRLIIKLAGLFLIFTQASIAEESQFKAFLGEWASDGAAFGQKAHSTMKWTDTLDGAFIRLEYQINMENSEGKKSRFEGVAHYKVSNSPSIKGYWADNTGDLHPISAVFEGTGLMAHWGVEGGKQGRTRYNLVSADTIDVTDWIKTADGWKQFNHNSFKRSP